MEVILIQNNSLILVHKKELSDSYLHPTHHNIVGVVERRNRTILNLVQTMLKERFTTCIMGSSQHNSLPAQ